MYHSGFFASDIIETVKSETNDSFPVSLSSYVNWINMVEQLLYSDIVKEQRLSEMPFKNVISFGELPLDEACEDIPRFADIIHIYGINADGSSVEYSVNDYIKVEFNGVVEELTAVSMADKRIPRVFAIEKIDTAKTDTE
jgi:hypothetical protein